MGSGDACGKIIKKKQHYASQTKTCVEIQYCPSLGGEVSECCPSPALFPPPLFLLPPSTPCLRLLAAWDRSCSWKVFPSFQRLTLTKCARLKVFAFVLSKHHLKLFKIHQSLLVVTFYMHVYNACSLFKPFNCIEVNKVKCIPFILLSAHPIPQINTINCLVCIHSRFFLSM